jgi:hypothetical protein
MFEQWDYGEKWHDFIGFGDNPPPLPIRFLTSVNLPSAPATGGQPLMPNVASHDLSHLIQSAVAQALATNMLQVHSQVKSAVASGIAELSTSLRAQVRHDAKSVPHPSSDSPTLSLVPSGEQPSPYVPPQDFMLTAPIVPF